MTTMICNYPTLDGSPCQNPVLLDSDHCAAGHPLDHARATGQDSGPLVELVDWDGTLDEGEALTSVATSFAPQGWDSFAPQGWDPHTEVYDDRSAWGGDPWEQLSDEEIDLKRKNIRDHLELDSFHDLPGTNPETIARLKAQDRQLADIQRRRLDELAKEPKVRPKVTVFESDNSMVKRSALTNRAKGAKSSWTGSELRLFAFDYHPNYGTGLCRAKLPEATIWEADLGGVLLEVADLRDSQIYRATGDIITSFKGANLRRSTIKQSSLAWSNFSYTDMRESRLSDVNFQHADLQSADFRGAHLVGVDFTRAVVRDADFRGATFENCKFNRVDITEALFDEDVKALIIRETKG